MEREQDEEADPWNANSGKANPLQTSQLQRPVTTTDNSATNENVVQPEQQSNNLMQQQSGQLVVKVDDPQKHGEGIQNAYVTYRLTTSTTSAAAAEQQLSNSARRRYGDFEILRSFLIIEYPACIIPPLPPKQRLDYLDRFEPKFLQRRQMLLQIFIQRILSHPQLAKDSAVQSFLRQQTQQDDWKCPPNTVPEGETLLDSVTDSLISAFSKVKTADDRIAALHDANEVYQENMQSIEKYYSRLLRAYDDFSRTLSSMASELSMSDVHETSHIDEYLAYLQRFALKVQRMAAAEDVSLLLCLTSQAQYCQAAKATLKMRDQKQIDYESLVDFLKQVREEKEALKYPSTRSMGLANSVKEKYAELMGTDMDRRRQEKLQRLENKAVELEKAIQSSEKICKKFSECVFDEFKSYDRIKGLELKDNLKSTVNQNVELFEKSLLELDNVIANHLKITRPPQ